MKKSQNRVRANHRPATKGNQSRAHGAEAQQAKALAKLIGPEVAAEVIAQAKAEGEGIENFVTDAMSRSVFQAQKKTKAVGREYIFSGKGEELFRLPLTEEQWSILRAVIDEDGGFESTLSCPTKARDAADSARATPSKALKCAVCNVAAATLHLSQLKAERLFKLDVCDECAEAFHLIPPGESRTPTPASASVSSAPSQAYLDSLNRRAKMRGGSPGGFTLTLPGVGLCSSYTQHELLDEVSIALYVSHDLIKECILARLPAWEAIEVAELVCISWKMHGGPDWKPNSAGVWDSHLPCGSLDMNVSTGDLLLHYCSLLHHHATLLSGQLIPKLPFACEAVRLARVLAIAEQVLAHAGDKAVQPGTVANPSPLLQRALELHGGALLRADESMSIENLHVAAPPARDEDKRIGQRADATVTEAKVAA